MTSDGAWNCHFDCETRCFFWQSIQKLFSKQFILIPIYGFFSMFTYVYRTYIFEDLLGLSFFYFYVVMKILQRNLQLTMRKIPLSLWGTASIYFYFYMDCLSASNLIMNGNQLNNAHLLDFETYVNQFCVTSCKRIPLRYLLKIHHDIFKYFPTNNKLLIFISMYSN